MNINSQEYLDRHINEVTLKHSIAKAAEECSELSHSLIQLLSKENGKFPFSNKLFDNLIGEIADVEMNLYIMKKRLEIRNIDISKATITKIDKLKDLKKTIPNFGQL